MAMLGTWKALAALMALLVFDGNGSIGTWQRGQRSDGPAKHIVGLPCIWVKGKPGINCGPLTDGRRVYLTSIHLGRHCESERRYEDAVHVRENGEERPKGGQGAQKKRKKEKKRNGQETVEREGMLRSIYQSLYRHAWLDMRIVKEVSKSRS